MLLIKMNRLIFLFLSLICFTPVFSQTFNIQVWNKWCAKKDTMVLFVAGNNVIQVYCPSLKPAEIKLKSLDKSLRIGIPEIKGDTTNVIAMPYPAKGAKMRLAVLNSKTSQQIKVVEFTCDTIAKLVAKIGNLPPGDAKKKDILAQSVMKTMFPKSLYNYPYSIRQYTFKVSTAKGGATIPVKGFFLTNDVLKEISAAPEGTIIEFTDIKATCPDCAPRALDNIKMRIK
jgi:GldM C-terminal domain